MFDPVSAHEKKALSMDTSAFAAIPRIGTGVDMHPFQPGVPMRLAGLDRPDEPVGLAGSPDGDVVTHAACNALLTAADLGDVGTHFATDTPEWSTASPTELLVRTASLVRTAGFRIGNVSVQLIGEHPVLGPHRLPAQKVLSEAAGAAVHLAAVTPEGLGMLGRSEGLVAVANALVVSVEAAAPAPH